MKFLKTIIVFFLVFYIQYGVFLYADTISGNVEKREVNRRHRVIDANTQNGLPFATVSIPSKNFETKTDTNGFFELNANISNATILSVKKNGYRPFSLTIDKNISQAPIVISIEKTQFSDLSIYSDIIHLGDNNFSEKSANSSDFKLKSVGPFFSKMFKISNIEADENVYFVIGSVIGVDTLISRRMGQSRVTTSYASPALIYFNGYKIAEIKFNSDGQQILLPKQLIKQNDENEITIKAGKNLFQSAYIDYDDIEIANLYIETKPVIANEY